MNGRSHRIDDHFDGITDPRRSNKRHHLLDIITIALCAVICGCDGWEQVEEFGEVKHDWFKTFLSLPHGIPSHDTFGRVFACIDPVEFQSSFVSWMGAIQAATEGEVVAIDGKTLRRSHDRGGGQKPIHMVSAWASENQVVLGQVKTSEHSNEIEAIPLLLRLLDVHGCIVTIDAMGCQKAIAGQIVDQGADYLLALKANQGLLYDDVSLFFKDAVQSDFRDLDYGYHQTVDGDHGRIETRRYWTTSEIDWLPDKERWRNLQTVVMVERQREINERLTSETSYYITSLENHPQQIARAVRRHWSIDNSLHWVLDIAFREDESRIRKDHAPENAAVLRHMALNLLKKENSKRRSIKTKRLVAGWDNQFLHTVLNQ
jgi:predicted transposase YbfD/YdcC